MLTVATDLYFLYINCCVELHRFIFWVALMDFKDVFVAVETCDGRLAALVASFTTISPPSLRDSFACSGTL